MIPFSKPFFPHSVIDTSKICAMSTPAAPSSMVQIPSFNPFMFWQKQNRNPNQIICAFHLVAAHNRSRFLNLTAFAREKIICKKRLLKASITTNIIVCKAL